jgi:hypothetical protein
VPSSAREAAVHATEADGDDGRALTGRSRNQQRHRERATRRGRGLTATARGDRGWRRAPQRRGRGRAPRRGSTTELNDSDDRPGGFLARKGRCLGRRYIAETIGTESKSGDARQSWLRRATGNDDATRVTVTTQSIGRAHRGPGGEFASKDCVAAVGDSPRPNNMHMQTTGVGEDEVNRLASIGLGAHDVPVEVLTRKGVDVRQEG